MLVLINNKNNSKFKTKQTKRKTPVEHRTSGAVSTDALPDNKLPLPQHCPHQVPRATADLDHLSGEGDLLPRGAFGIVETDSLSKPHLKNSITHIQKKNKTTTTTSPATKKKGFSAVCQLKLKTCGVMYRLDIYIKVCV